MKKRLAILGSTGSIGRQTLEVVEQFPELFEVEVLTALKSSDKLIEQAKKYRPNAVVIADETEFQKVREGLSSEPVKVYAGSRALEQIVQMSTIDVVVAAMVGYAGLAPTVEAVKAGKSIALANKETLVVAGDLITRLAKEKGIPLLPVDSEHSAIFQCLQGEWQNPIEKLILTASGGPFRITPANEMAQVSREQALNHPSWQMGAKITIDSATMMNKGFEVIEARWLFGVPADRIDVVVHPESIVHSLVQFEDGSVKAQMGLPDMRLPIRYALSYPIRLPDLSPRLNLAQCGTLHFEAPDTNRFRNLHLAYQALREGGNMPCILNAANEASVALFLSGAIRFQQIAEINEEAMNSMPFTALPNLEDYRDTHLRTMDYICRKYS